jgi:hypothetical protein
MRSSLGKVSKGMILRMMLVSHMAWRRTRKPKRTRAATAAVRIRMKMMKAMMKLRSSF